MKQVLAVLVLGVTVLVSCRPPGSDHAPTPAPPPGCELRLQVPPRFSRLETFREPYADHVGVRIGFVDQRGRELHAFAGIPGEFGEGLPAAGELELSAGGTGLVAGSGQVWVLEWTEGGACDPRALLSNGFSRAGFEDLVRELGIVVQTG